MRRRCLLCRGSGLQWFRAAVVEVLFRYGLNRQVAEIWKTWQMCHYLGRLRAGLSVAHTTNLQQLFNWLQVVSCCWLLRWAQ